MEKTTFNTFKHFGDYELSNMKIDDPTCFNGMVRVQKYKITIELVNEPKDVIEKRLQLMWDNCGNHHQREPLIREADKFGVILKP